MVSWVVIAAMIGLGGFAASTLAVWGWGRFARRARGAATYVLPATADATALDEVLSPLTAAHPDQTGLALLSSNVDAFVARVMAARRAGRSLDLMYYIWEEDLTGRLLLAEVLAAARRGVRVRLLLDDIGVSSRDELFLALNAHPRIEVRLFNPTRARKGSLRRGIEMGLRFFSVTRRMHNKAWIADGRLAITGGRNISDAYFDAAETSNFRDLDLIVVGPVVDQAGAMFDGYWNSGLALPIRSLAGEIRDTRLLHAEAERLLTLGTSPEAAPYIAHLQANTTRIVPGENPLQWCSSARLVADPPEKALGRQGENWMMRGLMPVLAAARQRITITSPYFIPGAEGAAQFAAITARGVQVEVLTNSLAATDVAAVHGGYAPWRGPLLRSGVTLHELRPTGRRRLSFRGSKNASLHTKAFTVDRQTGFVGSLNFDPRSASLNTEMGVLFEQPGLIAAMDRIFAQELSPDYSWRLGLDPAGRLLWHGDTGQPPLRRDPEASRWRRGFARLVGWLPLESQL